VLGSSRVAGSWLCAEPSLGQVFTDPALVAELDRPRYLARLAAPPGEPEAPDAFFGRLRRVRRSEMLRIIAREALALAPVPVTAREMSALAEAAVEEALAWSWAQLCARHGEPRGAGGEPNRPCVLGMGKLGGGELNLSSDVDLLFLYRTGRGETTGGPGGRLDARSFFARLVRLAVEALGRVTGEGFVFRVDLDLRPEGRNGPLAQPLDDAAGYYLSWGQTWERAALLRARPIAGDPEVGRRFLAEVEPFVFRRSLDYTTVEDLAEMKQRIAESSGRRAGGGADLKLGRGGIRELEFFVQTLQLVHGGRLPRVREPNTLEGLGLLAGAGAVAGPAAEDLAGCYRFLRTLEHAVQSLHLLRTHRLPCAPEELRVVARRQGFGGDEPVGPFLAALEGVRSRVHRAYDGVVRGGDGGGRDEPGAREAREVLSLAPHDPRAAAVLERAGFRNPDKALAALTLLRSGPPGPRVTARARRLLQRVAPTLLGAARQCPDPDQALVWLGEFLAASGAREGYLSLLEANPATARLLVTLFGTSGFLSRYLVGHPELLDELVLGSYAVGEKSLERLEAELAESLGGARDEEERLDALRRFRNAQFLRIAWNDLHGALGPEEAAAQVTLVAQACLEAACRDAREHLTRKYGLPEQADGGPLRFAVLGLGKLGAAELDYHSDLDVIFVYQGGREAASAGRSRPAAAELAARLAQRVISLLSATTREGIAFRMDARLRPSGRAGPLVTSLPAFDAYHRGGGGQTWERQALIRLRPVAGDPGLGREARRVVDRLLFQGPPALDPRPELRRMRDRLRAERGREEGGGIDLKAGPGGLWDVAFAVQALQLLHGWRAEALQSPNLLLALEGLKREGLLADEDGATLAEGYRFLRRVEARLRIVEERPTDVLPRQAGPLGALARGLGYAQAQGGGEAMVRELERHRRKVSAVCDEILRGGAA
jgi:glutamate-ammonia-ligase adenylyltransferase